MGHLRRTPWKAEGFTLPFGLVSHQNPCSHLQLRSEFYPLVSEDTCRFGHMRNFGLLNAELNQVHSRATTDTET